MIKLGCGVIVEEILHKLVAGAKRGDVDAFTQLIRKYETTVLGVAFSMTGDSELASEIAQQSFIRAWQRLKDLKQANRFAAWVCQIARNIANDLHRTKRISSQVPELIDPNSPAPHEQLDQAEISAAIQIALDSLDSITRTTVVLRYFDGLSSREIARILSTSPAAVDMRLSRARDQLRQLLAPQMEI
jgi:RNA polymerase sigma-70 factor (ECF subfamily)